MISSQSVTPYDQSMMMNPKDERLVLMAYNIGRYEVNDNLMELKNRRLIEELGEMKRQVERSQAEADRERRRRDELQETYDKLNKYALKQEKLVEKLKKENNNG